MSTERPGKGLGMGLQALIGEAARPLRDDGEPPMDRGVREIEVGRIAPNPNQPRVTFDEEALEELAESIRERGVLQPILVRPNGDAFGHSASANRLLITTTSGVPMRSLPVKSRPASSGSLSVEK